MTLGTKNRKEVWTVAVLFLILLLVGAYNFRDQLWGGSPAETSSLLASPGAQQWAGTTLTMQDSEPRLNLETLQGSREIPYEPGNRNPFTYAGAVPHLENSVRKAATPTVTPYVPTSTPIPGIPVRFYGFASKPGEPRRIFLSVAGRNFVAGLSEIVDRRYRVFEINANQVVIEDMLSNDPSNNHYQIPLAPR